MQISLFKNQLEIISNSNADIFILIRGIYISNIDICIYLEIEISLFISRDISILNRDISISALNV